MLKLSILLLMHHRNNTLYIFNQQCLEAYQAKIFIKSLLLKGKLKGLVPNNTEILLRTYLCSSRTFKDCLIKNNSFSDNLKELILELPMPKFIWITEISDKTLMKSKKANGIIILDATEPNTNDNKPLLIATP